MTRITGDHLNKIFSVGARQAFYRETGDWYMCLEYFPGVLFDRNGYVLFETKADYENCPFLQIGKRLTVPSGISAIPGYVNIKFSN